MSARRSVVSRAREAVNRVSHSTAPELSTQYSNN
jgi:hypothetical protein